MLIGLGALSGLLLVSLGPVPLCGWFLHTAKPYHYQTEASPRARPSYPPSHRHAERTIHWLSGTVLWCALQMTIATGLAALGQFHWGRLALVEAALLLLGLLLLWRARQPAAADRAATAHIPLPPTHPPLPWLPLLTAAFVALVLFGNLASQPITDYDSLYYHLPFVATLHSSGALSTMAVPAAVAWYPYGWESLGALWVLPVGEDLLVAFPNLVAWAIVGLAIYALARRGGAATEYAAIGALLPLTMPLMLDQINTLRVDLAVAAFLLAGFVFALETTRWQLDFPLMLTLLSVGLLAATKSSGLLYGALLLAMLATRWVWVGPIAARPRSRLDRLTQGGAWLLPLLTLASASYWYGRNWYFYGNPLGWLEVKLAGWVLWPGPLMPTALRRSTLAALFDPTQADHWYRLAQQGWYQLALPGLLLFSLFLLLLYALLFRRSVKAPRALPVWGTMLLMGLLFAFFWVTPFSGDDGTHGWQLTGAWLGQSMRFALPALALLAVCAAWGAARFTLPVGPLIVTALIGSLFTLAQRSTLYLVATVGFGVGLGLLYWLWPRLQQDGWVRRFVSKPGGLLTIGLLGLLGTLLALIPLQQIRTERRPLVYGELPQVIETLTAPQTTIAALYSHQSYLAAGPHLQRSVLQAPTDFTSPQQLLDWLNQHTIEWLVVGPVRPEWPVEPLFHWLATDEQRVERLYDQGATEAVLYRIHQP
ncbi:MAG: hypothetical protein KF832_03595 [Caldilineaceae bacterium]|nr:hypothetical protein [Caldilineaceae bacterium]